MDFQKEEDDCERTKQASRQDQIEEYERTELHEGKIKKRRLNDLLPSSLATIDNESITQRRNDETSKVADLTFQLKKLQIDMDIKFAAMKEHVEVELNTFNKKAITIKETAKDDRENRKKAQIQNLEDEFLNAFEVKKIARDYFDRMRANLNREITPLRKKIEKLERSAVPSIS